MAAAGQLVVFSGQLVGSCLGQTVTRWGHCVRTSGQFVAPAGHRVLRGGQVVAASGHCVRTAGQRVVLSGHAVNCRLGQTVIRCGQNVLTGLQTVGPAATVVAA